MTTTPISYTIGDRLYLNITNHCTLACAFCPKTLGHFMVHEYDLTLDHRPTVEEIIKTVGDSTAYREVVFCGYGEPTLRLKVLLEVARQIKAQGGRVRVNTDGLANLVHKGNVLPKLALCVDALSISMNAQDADTYNQHCHPALRGSFEAMLDFLTQAPLYISDVTATAIEGLERVDIEACRRLATERGGAFRKRTLDVVG